jgi:hypothetical protein
MLQVLMKKIKYVSASLYHSNFRLQTLKMIAKGCKSFSQQWKQLSWNIHYGLVPLMMNLIAQWR